MEIQNNLIYKLRDRIGELIIFPLGESDFTIEYERESEIKLSYQKNMSGKMTLVNQAFSRIMELETSMYRCDEQEVEVSKDCNGSEVILFTGRISLNEARFDLDRCLIEVKFLKEIDGKCINDGKGTKYNMFNLTSARKVVKPIQAGGGVYEYRECIKSGYIMPDESYGLAAWCTGSPNSSTYDTTEADINNWLILSNSVRMNGDISMNPNPDPDPSNSGGMLSLRTRWVREIVTLECDEMPSIDWVLISDNCPTGKKKYAKKPDLYDCRFDSQIFIDNWNFSYYYNCKIVGEISGGGSIPELDNGIHFTDFFNSLISAVCLGMQIKSDFFQINPENPTDINYVTSKKSTVNNIIIFQKADVKRPNAYNQSMNLQMSLEDFLKMLSTMFNVRWRLIEGVFVIEHVSFFSKELGFDIEQDYKEYFVGRKAYTYDAEKIPPSEIFDFKEKSYNPDWRVEVEYKGCVLSDATPTTIVLDGVMTDVTWAVSNSSSDSSVVTDTGIVMISTNKLGDNYYINSEDGINGRTLNNVFSWARLFRDYHYYERPMKSGVVNGVYTDFKTSIPTKKGDIFSIPLNVCTTVFNPDRIVKTSLGDGIVSAAKYKVKGSMLELELLYESNNDLKQNKPPTISGGGVFFGYKNISETFDIVTSDEDGTVIEIAVINAPFNGTLNILSLTQVEYVPDLNYVGADFFTIAAKDDLSELSTPEYFTITIRESNAPPVAVDDNFEMLVGDTFNQQLSIFANDHDDYGFFLVESNLVTNEGVNVTIDNFGFFDYVPPVGFDGLDFFDYTIEDDGGAQSTARVSIFVRALDKPVGVTDFYQTIRNTSFSNSVTGLFTPNLLVNDYTPDGQPYTYSTTYAVKATINGGSVTINSNGTFNYTPPNNFTGVDEFAYEVSNGAGTGEGIVKMSVLPRIYVSISLVNFKNKGLVINCDDQFEIGGYENTHDVVLSFFSDAAKTIPFDVSGLNFRVALRENTAFSNSGGSGSFYDDYLTNFLSGISYVVYQDYVTKQQNRDCLFQIVSEFEKTFTLLTGSYN